MDLAIQDGQKTRESPLSKGGHSCCVWKEENFLHRGSQIVLGGRYRKVGMRVMLREAIRARRKCAGMLCGLEGHHSGDLS